MREHLLIFFIFLLIQRIDSNAQKPDTIVTMRGNIIGYVKEVSPDLVAYTNPNETVVYKIEKGAIAKICFGSGRVEKFTELKFLPNLTGAYEWPKVDVATTEYETRGLYKLDLISVKATGTTIYSNVTRVQKRAINKLKMATALMGGNLIYIKSEALEGNNRSFARRTSREQILGTAYCSELLDENKFKAAISGKDRFTLITKIGLRNNDAAIKTFQVSNELVEINLVQVERGFVYLNLTINGIKSNLLYRVVSFSDNRIIVAYRKKTAYYNLTLTER